MMLHPYVSINLGIFAVSYYFSDFLKTASVITDATGNVKSDSDYYPWGGDLQFTNGDPNHYKFTGKERDAESGLDYFGARYYSNGLGRFITPDWSAVPVPVPYADLTDPQSLNQYTYVRNLPTTKVDKDGHCVEDLCIGEAIVVVAAVKWGVGLFLTAVAGVVTYHHFHGNSSRIPPPPPPVNAGSGAQATSPPPPGQPQNQNNKRNSQLKANKAKGQAFEKKVVNATKATDSNVAEQVTLKTESGVKTRMDVVSQDASGQIRLQEAKASDSAPLTENQAAAHPEIEQSGATVAGDGKPGYPGGTQIPPNKS